MAYPDQIWARIRNEWLAGQLSLSDISRNYGPTRQAILKRAKLEVWPSRGTLIEEVRREINTHLISDTDPGKVTAEVTPQEHDELIGAAAKRGLSVVRVHKGLIDRLLGQVKVTLDDLDEMTRFDAEVIKKGKMKLRSKMISTIINSRIDAADSVSKILARAIPLERQAFSLDSEGAEVQSIKYVISEKIKKPKGTGLSEDEWEKDETE